MDMTMSIAALATTMQQTRTQEAVSISLLKKTMDMQESQTAALIEGMQNTSAAPTRHMLDILA